MNVTQSENYGLASLITQIAMTYLSSYYDICVVWQRGSFELTLNTILMYSRSSNNDTRQTGSLPPYRLYKFNDNETERQEMMVAAVNFGCRVFLISTDTALLFSTAYIGALNYFIQRNPDNRFIFIPSEDTKRNTVDLVLKLPITYHIPDYLIITPLEENGDSMKYDIVTTKYVGRHNHTAPIVLDNFCGLSKRFANGSVHLFSNKILNLNGRLLKLTLLNYKPYTLWRKTAPGLGNANILDSDEEKNLFIDGTEVRLFLAFCEKYNCTIAVWAAGEDDWGGTFPNGSGTGLLGAIVTRSVDVGVSALFSDWYEEYVNLDQSIAIQRASMAIIAPRPILKPEWQLPALPFSLYLWLAVAASFVVSVIGLATTDYFIDVSRIAQIPNDRVNVNHIVFEVTSLLFGQSVERILTSTSAMVIYGCILLISMIIDSAYTGGLSSFMAVPRYEDPIDTVHQLAAKGWKWGGAMDAWVYSILLAQQVDVRRLLDLFTIFSYKQLSDHLKTGDYSYAIERLQYGHFSIPKYITLESIDYLRLMRDDIYYDYTTAMCYKTWPYKRMLNPMIRQVVESGLMRQWELQVALKYLDNQLQLAVTNSRFSHNDNSGPIALSTSHLLGAFMLLLFGHVIAFIMLVGEIGYAHRRQKKAKKATNNASILSASHQ